MTMDAPWRTLRTRWYLARSMCHVCPLCALLPSLAHARSAGIRARMQYAQVERLLCGYAGAGSVVCVCACVCMCLCVCMRVRVRVSTVTVQP